MSDTSQGEGWWIASDGKWYAPELHPDYVAPVAPPTPDPLAAPTYPSSPPMAAETTIAPAATMLPDSLAAPAEPAQSRRGLLLGIGALILLVGLGFLLFRLLGGGGTATGAASPDEAVQQLSLIHI